MDAAHHLAWQIVEGRDIKLEGREGDADPVGERAPPARAEAFRKTVLEIVELDLDGRFGGAVWLFQHFKSSLARHARQHWPRAPNAMPWAIPGIRESPLVVIPGRLARAELW